MKKLISNTAYGKRLETEFLLSNIDYKEYFILRNNYDNLLFQTLEIWMFVPADLEGNVLEEKSIFNTTDEDYIFDSESFDKYQQAKEACLFEGFEIIKPSDKCFILLCLNKIECQFLLNTDYSFYDVLHKDKTIEDLVKHSPTLTPTALKTLGL